MNLERSTGGLTSILTLAANGLSEVSFARHAIGSVKHS